MPADMARGAADLASAMVYLGSLGIVHRDLAARNVRPRRWYCTVCLRRVVVRARVTPACPVFMVGLGTPPGRDANTSTGLTT